MSGIFPFGSARRFGVNRNAVPYSNVLLDAARSYTANKALAGLLAQATLNPETLAKRNAGEGNPKGLLPFEMKLWPVARGASNAVMGV